MSPQSIGNGGVLSAWVRTVFGLLCFAFAFPRAEIAAAQCGGFNQRACCIGQGEPCVGGAVQVNTCVGQLGANACRCWDGLEIFAEGVCRQVPPCGNPGQRACCSILEFVPNCGAGMAEVPGCVGDCLCGGTARNGERSSGMCVPASPCGGAGQRACCVLERGLGGACQAGLSEIPGCTGDCYCAVPDLPGQVSSSTCSAKGAIVEPGVDATPSATPPSCPLRGYADLHLHLFGHLAHGQGVLAGKSYSALGVNDALSNDADFTLHKGHLLADDVVGFGTNDADGIFGSGNQGQPAFNNWPNWHSTTHQQAYYKWLERAWRGGLRLAVMLAVTNEALCKSSSDQPDSVCEDSMAAIDAQLDAALALEQTIDQQAGGSGRGWFRIVRTPAEARLAIATGKLAVVLGIEVEHPFNCRWDGCRGKAAGETDLAYVRRELDRYYAKGVRHIFPIHNFDNAFGGPATWQTSIDVGNRAVEGHWWSASDCPGEGYGFKLGGIGNQFESFFINLFGFGGVENVPSHDGDASCNALGLTALGRSFIAELMQRGMIIDVDHMSIKAFDETLDLTERHTPPYPVVASHVQFFDRHVESIRHERMRTEAQLARIRDGGGMIAAMLKDDVQDTSNGGKRYTLPYGSVPDDCIHSSLTFAHAFQYAADVMDGPVAFGSDFNGIAAHVGPRFGSEACGGRIGAGGAEGDQRKFERQTQIQRGNRLRYPFTLPGFGTFERQRTGERAFDLNHHGLAHVGMLPDLVAELANVGLPGRALERLYASAEGYIATWERATGASADAVCRPVAAVVAADAQCRANPSVVAGSQEGLVISAAPPGPYGLGTTRVEVSVQRQNSCFPADTCTSTVQVVDRTAPVITAPNLTLECQTPAGAIAPLGVSARDACDGAVSVASDAPPLFALNQTALVHWTARDVSNNVATATQAVSVVDTTPPVVTCPANIVSECLAGLAPSVVLVGQASAKDACGPATTPTHDGRPPFRLGTTTVTHSSRDAGGRVGRCLQTVSVVDRTPPRVVAAIAVPPVLPATGALRTISLQATAIDNCDVGPVPCSIRSITSSPAAPAADILITGTNSATVRTERGRVYMLGVECRDRAGLAVQTTTEVRVL